MFDPVIASFGRADNPPQLTAAETDWRERSDAVELMAQAAEEALADALSAGASPNLAAQIDTVIVPRGSWGFRNPGRTVAERLGASDARTISVELGVLQTVAFSEALQRLARGHSSWVLVLGGEARFRGLAAKIVGEAADEAANVDVAGTEPDETIAPQTIPVHRVEIDHRLVDAVDQYAMVDNARRVRQGLSIEAHRDDIDALAHQMHSIASHNPRAWFGQERPPGFFRTPSTSNRPLALPYNKWHSTQWNVDQASAFLLGTKETARAAGIDPATLVPILGVANSEAVVPLSERRDLAATPGTRATVDAVLNAAGRSLDEVAHLDLYSCFPAAVRLQQEALGLDHSIEPTVTGGMAFAGGPFNNAALQAAAAVCARLRDDPEGVGVVTAFSGMVTKQGAIALGGAATTASRTVSESSGTRVFDVTDDVLSRSPRTTVVGDHTGGGVIATYTVRYRDGQPDNAVVLADLPDGSRALAVSTDPGAAVALSDGEWIGRPVALEQGGFSPA